MVKKKTRRLKKAEIIRIATSNRISARKISQVVKGDFVDKWCGTVAGKVMSGRRGWLFKTREQALASARWAKAHFHKYCVERGWLQAC